MLIIVYLYIHVYVAGSHCYVYLCGFANYAIYFIPDFVLIRVELFLFLGVTSNITLSMSFCAILNRFWFVLSEVLHPWYIISYYICINIYGCVYMSVYVYVCVCVYVCGCVCLYPCVLVISCLYTYLCKFVSLWLSAS